MPTDDRYSRRLQAVAHIMSDVVMHLGDLDAECLACNVRRQFACNPGGSDQRSNAKRLISTGKSGNRAFKLSVQDSKPHMSVCLSNRQQTLESCASTSILEVPAASMAASIADSSVTL